VSAFSFVSDRARALAAVALLTAATIAWAAAPLSGGSAGTLIALVVAVGSGAASLAGLVVGDAQIGSGAFDPLPVRVAADVAHALRVAPWSQTMIVAVLVLEVLHPARPWHTGVLAVALLTLPAVVLARILRLEVIAALRADYVRTARAKRLPGWRTYLLHVLPNALTATLTICGLLLAAMIAGTVLVENVFAWPGLGSEIVSSIIAKDYPVVQAIVLVYGTGVLLINLIVDVALALLDPRSTIRES